MIMHNNFQFIQFTVSVFLFHFKRGMLSEGAAIISSVFQENVNKLECNIINPLTTNVECPAQWAFKQSLWDE
jgi:hypothetical protein